MVLDDNDADFCISCLGKDKCAVSEWRRSLGMITSRIDRSYLERPLVLLCTIPLRCFLLTQSSKTAAFTAAESADRGSGACCT